MFGRTVRIDGGKEFFVTCTPSTPLDEVLRRAAEMAKRERESSEMMRTAGTAPPLHIEIKV